MGRAEALSEVIDKLLDRLGDSGSDSRVALDLRAELVEAKVEKRRYHLQWAASVREMDVLRARIDELTYKLSDEE